VNAAQVSVPGSAGQLEQVEQTTLRQVTAEQQGKNMLWHIQRMHTHAEAAAHGRTEVTATVLMHMRVGAALPPHVKLYIGQAGCRFGLDGAAEAAVTPVVPGFMGSSAQAPSRLVFMVLGLRCSWVQYGICGLNTRLSDSRAGTETEGEPHL